MNPPRIRSRLLDEDSLAHGFFGRGGGVSSGPYSSLNAGLGTSDNPDHVRENRTRCASALGVSPASLLTLHQVHSPDVLIVREPFDLSSRPKADAMVSDRPNIALGILSADCMPFLFADLEARVIGAAHAGWRGALSGVLEATVEVMRGLGARPESLRAALGPCLHQPNFEVGLELVEAFTDKHREAAQFFAPGVSVEKRQLDLAGYARWRLAEMGVCALDDLRVCTLADGNAWFSYRGSRRRGEADYGRNLSAIALKPA